MAANTNRLDRDLREKIVCLLLSNPQHKPSSVTVRPGKDSKYIVPQCGSTIGLANDLIHFIETGSDVTDTKIDDIIL